MEDIALKRIRSALVHLLQDSTLKDELTVGDVVPGTGRVARRVCILLKRDGWEDELGFEQALFKLSNELGKLKTRSTVTAYDVKRAAHDESIIMVTMAAFTKKDTE